MKRFISLVVVSLCLVLTACGGGGGSPGTAITSNVDSANATGTGTGTGGTTSTATPTLSLSVIDSAGNVVPSNSIGGGVRRIKAVVKDAQGVPKPLQLVSFGAVAGFANLNPASGLVLTDGSGAAQILITPADVNTSGASSVGAGVKVDGIDVTGSINIQAASSNVQFGILAATTRLLSAYQSTAVDVPVIVDGASAAAGQVSVNFSPSCGRFSPATVATGSDGRARTTYIADNCGGTVTLSASAGTANANATVQVTAPAATALRFTSAVPSKIFSQQALFGDQKALVKFQLVDQNGAGIDGQTVELSLSDSAVAAGVVFADTGAATSSQATSGGGFVSTNVRSGDLPTPVIVNAKLVSNSAIQASSGGLVVNSGAPVQNFFSISASSFNIEGFNYDGVTATVSIRVADRLAQPVPDGTVITFVAEGGQITASCNTAIDTDGKSGCSVIIASQDARPDNGRVTVLAYADGLEPFVDTNGDNKFTSGESFADMGQPFIDKNENGSFDADEQKIGAAGSPGLGTQACAAVPLAFGVIPPSVPNTCSGGQGKAYIRAQAVIAFSTNFSDIPETIVLNSSKWTFKLKDEKGNAMPSGSEVIATLTGGKACSIDRVVPSKVGSTPNPTIHTVLLKVDTTVAGATCAGATINASVKTPRENETLFSAVVPVPVP